jgi:hypothetical protein
LVFEIDHQVTTHVFFPDLGRSVRLALVGGHFWIAASGWRRLLRSRRV